MSKREILAWTSLGSFGAVLGYYLIVLVGLPEGAADYAESIKDLFLRIFVMAFVIEFVLDLVPRKWLGIVDRDERDVIIEGKGYRNAYLFLAAAVVGIGVNLFLSDVIRASGGESVFFAIPFATVHALLIALLTAGLVNAATRLYFYRMGVRYGRV